MWHFLDLTSCLRSPLVTILAGENRERLTVHSFVLSQAQSPNLQALVNGQWKESTDGTIDWSHTDLETIQRVISFLYTEDYKAPDPNERTQRSDRVLLDGKAQEAVNEVEDNVADHDLPGEDPITPDTPQPEFEPEPATDFPEVAEPEVAASPELPPARSADSIDEPQVQNALLESTLERPLTPVTSCVGLPPVSIVRRTFAGIFADSELPYSRYSYADTLVAHAQVYYFADSHLLEPLKNLALQRLSQTLRKVDCTFAAASEEIARVIADIYENTRSGTDEPLRKIVSQFATINYTSLLHGDFEDLISRGGDFTRDIARKLRRRLNSHYHAVEYDGHASDESQHRLQIQLDEKDDKIRELKYELDAANAWGRGLGRRNGRR